MRIIGGGKSALAAAFTSGHRGQRWLMGTMLAGFALRMAFEAKQGVHVARMERSAIREDQSKR
jgi:hypothetical protein